MGNIELNYGSLSIAFLLLAIPLALSFKYKLKIEKPIIYSTLRMTIQLILVGYYLKYLFEINNVFLNILWLIVMIIIAVWSAFKSFSMKINVVLLPAFISFFISTFFIVIFINYFVLKLTYVFDARYLIVLGGMVLGNSLRGNIIGISHFYTTIRKDMKNFMYILSLGATLDEAVLPYLKESINIALKPTFAAMATMGIVALPGMMTGVILGGQPPENAIKYQIMIMMAILAGTILSIFLTINMTKKVCFKRNGELRGDIFDK